MPSIFNILSVAGATRTHPYFNSDPLTPLMKGTSIIIDESKCDGCGLCVTACHEGALALVGGKARVVRDDLCDGMGDCLPACPQGAISFAEKPASRPSGIPMMPAGGSTMPPAPSGVQWPIQLALVPSTAGFLRSRLVVGADCTAFTADDFKRRFVHGDPLVIGCPKLDDRARFDKIADILRDNDITSVDVIRMEVPCCGALVRLVRAAVQASGKDIPVNEITVRRDGSLLRSKEIRQHPGQGIRVPSHLSVQGARYHHVVHGVLRGADVGLDPEAGDAPGIGVSELNAGALVGHAAVHVQDQRVAGIEKCQIRIEHILGDLVDGLAVPLLHPGYLQPRLLREEGLEPVSGEPLLEPTVVLLLGLAEERAGNVEPDGSHGRTWKSALRNLPEGNPYPLPVHVLNMDESVFADAERYAAEIFKDDSSGHDFYHTVRVHNNAVAICREEGGDMDTVRLAALLHDVDDRKLFGDNGMANARSFMASHGISGGMQDSVCHIISQISFKGKDTVAPDTLEGRIVQDADRLDAIGAIGIARTFAYGGSRGRAMHIPSEKAKEDMTEEEYFANQGTSVNHFHEKLLKLRDLMNTPTARRIADARHEYMIGYLEEFMAEWEGERRIC